MTDINEDESFEFNRDEIWPLLLKPLGDSRTVYYPPWLHAKHLYDLLNPLDGESDIDVANKAGSFIKKFPIDLHCLSHIMVLMLEANDSSRARERVMKKLANDPKQKEKAFVFECWQEWQCDPSRYRSKAAFAKDMLTKCEYLESQKKIEDWCREWEKISTQPAQ